MNGLNLSGLSLTLASRTSGGTPTPTPSSVTWNPADKSALLTLSGGDLTATKNAGSDGTYGTVRATTSRNAGTRSFRTTVATTAGDPGIGLSNATELLTNYLGETNNSIGIYSNGDVYVGGAVAINGGAIVNGDVVDWVVKFATSQVDIYVNSVLKVSNQSIAAISGALFPGFSGTGGGDAATGNFSVSVAGATAWDV